MTTPFTPQTLIYGFTPAADPDVSPDGTRVLYTLARTDAETKKSSSQVWVCDIDGANPRQLTTAGVRNRSARWSPDGSQAAFVSDRVEANGLFVLSMTGGEARELARHPTAIGDLAWSPDGSTIAYTAVVDPENPAGTRPAEGAAPPIRVTSRIDYKQDNRGYLNDTRVQVFVADVPARGCKQLTTEAVDHRAPGWSPDGKTLAIGVSTNNGMTSRLLLLSVADGGERWVGPEDGNVGIWAWSPDGTRIVFTGDPGHTYQADLFVYDVASGTTRQVTTDLPCAPYAGFPTLEPASMPTWLDDRTILFHANFRAASGLWTANLETGEVTQEEGTESVRVGFSTDRAHRYVAQGMVSLDAIGELLVIDREAGTSKVITATSAPVFAESPVADWERFDVRRGEFVTEAWLLKPPGFDPTKKYPVILDVHGGPNGFYGYAFNAIQQLLASNGFIVLYSNPRGSSSYGREFTMQVFGDWGGEDYEDLMAVVDEALKRPYCDASRTGIWGYSYGGYMTAWTIARNHRFKAAVCGAPCFDLESMFGTSDISHMFGRIQWGGAPHEAREWYATHSPSQYAHNTTTPTLIIQGEADERCPKGQAEQMFVALKTAGCEVEMARYPGGSHLFMRTGPAEHREDVLGRVLAWFQGHL